MAVAVAAVEALEGISVRDGLVVAMGADWLSKGSFGLNKVYDGTGVEVAFSFSFAAGF